MGKTAEVHLTQKTACLNCYEGDISCYKSGTNAAWGVFFFLNFIYFELEICVPK